MKIIKSLAGALALVCGAAAAQAQAASLDCAGALADCLLAEAGVAGERAARASQRDEVRFSVAVSLAQLDRLDEALVIARQISNPRTMAEALGAISQAAGRSGDFDQAYQIALGIVDARIDSARVEALEALAVAQAGVGQIDAAFDTVFAIDNPYRRSQAQAAIAISVARSGDIGGAIRTASKIATNYWFTSDQHQLKIASGIVPRFGEFDQFWFHEALAVIARIQAQNGDILGALQTANSIPDVGGRSRALARIAGVQAAAGDPEGALATASNVEAPYGDLEAMVAIAGVRADMGDFDGALDLARQIALAYGDGSALVAVAVKEAGQGAVETGLQTATAIENLDSRTRALAGIADVLVRDGRLDGALEAAALISDPRDRFFAYRNIAVVLAEAGDAARALQIAADHGGRRDEGEIVVAISRTQAISGDIDGAVATALQLSDDMLRGVALAEIAPYAGRGRPDQD